MKTCRHCEQPVRKDPTAVSGWSHVDDINGDYSECWYGDNDIRNGTHYADKDAS